MIKQVLIDARDLYAASPSHVPEGYYPADGENCVLSAIFHVENGQDFYWDARDAFADAAGTSQLVMWNATHTTEEVLAVFDLAIERMS